MITKEELQQLEFKQSTDWHPKFICVYCGKHILKNGFFANILLFKGDSIYWDSDHHFTVVTCSKSCIDQLKQSEACLNGLNASIAKITSAIENGAAFARDERYKNN